MTDTSPLRRLSGRLRFRAADRALAAIATASQFGDGVLGAVFTQFDAGRIADAAARVDAEETLRSGPLAGLLVSIKDLFDEAGMITGAGSPVVAAEGVRATADAPAVARLKAAGAIPCGRTSMSELAYSGVGLNPHYGNPGNIYDPSRISGGSTSGGAISVALGIADVALGSDTGGSVRIPAALNGLCGFKPTQASVPLDGALPLSGSYDSIGPIASTVGECAAVHAVLSGQGGEIEVGRRYRLAVARSPFLDDTDEQVADDFEAAISALIADGHEIVEVDLPFLEGFGAINRVIVASDAYSIHRGRLDRLKQGADPHIVRRILAAESFKAGEVADAHARRAAARDAFAQVASEHGIDGFLAPTIPIVAPEIAEVEADFDRLNALMLRNPSVVNLLDGCAATVPMDREGLATGLMIFAPGGHDWTVLSIAARAETLLSE